MQNSKLFKDLSEDEMITTDGGLICAVCIGLLIICLGAAVKRKGK